MQKVYSYTKLIKGNQFSLAFHNHKIAEIVASQRKGKTQETEELIYHKKQRDYFVDTIARQSLLRKVCGDQTVVIR